MTRSIALFLTAAGVIGLSGCAGTPKQAAADTGEYEWVTPTGSNIAVRLPKGQKPTVSTSPSGTITGDDASALVNGAGGKVPVDRGSR